MIAMLSELDREKIAPVLITQRESPLAEEARRLGVPVEICALPPSLESRREAALREPLWNKLANAAQIRSYNSLIQGVLTRHGCQGIWVRSVRGVLLCGTAANRLGIPLIWDIGMEKGSEGDP